MDLNEAKKQAATRSLADKKKVFINMLEGGVCDLASKQSEQTVHVFHNGNEIPLPDLKVEKKEIVKTTKNKKKKMETAKKKAAPKKAAKKVKAAAKKKPSGKGKMMAVKAIIAAMKQGKRAFTPGGTPHSLKYLEGVKDKNTEREVVFE